MDRLFIDTNIVIDLLAQRQPFYEFASEIFTLADRKKIELFISALCFNDLNYLLSKEYNKGVSRNMLIKLKSLVTILAVDDRIITLALHSSFADFEDAIQYYTALAHNVPIILTRDLKDYKDASIPVMTAEMYLKATK
jgi:predicted nucleic acid-binding protein